MGILLFICVTTFLGLFLVNNEPSVMLSSPMALGMVAATFLAALYLLRSLVRDWTRRRD